MRVLSLLLAVSFKRKQGQHETLQRDSVGLGVIQIAIHMIIRNDQTLADVCIL